MNPCRPRLKSNVNVSASVGSLGWPEQPPANATVSSAAAAKRKREPCIARMLSGAGVCVRRWPGKVCHRSMDDKRTRREDSLNQRILRISIRSSLLMNGRHSSSSRRKSARKSALATE